MIRAPTISNSALEWTHSCRAADAVSVAVRYWATSLSASPICRPSEPESIRTEGLEPEYRESLPPAPIGELQNITDNRPR